MSILKVEGFHAGQYHLVALEDGTGNIYRVWLLTIPLSWNVSDFSMIAIVDPPKDPLWRCRLEEIDTPRISALSAVTEGPLRPLPLTDHISEVAQDVVEAYLRAQGSPVPGDLRVSRYHREPVI